MVGCAALVRLLPLLTQLTQRFLHLAATQGLAFRAIEQPFGFGDQVLAHLVSAPALPALQFTCSNQSGMDLLLQSSIDVLPLGLEHCAQRSSRACTGFAVAFSRFFFQRSQRFAHRLYGFVTHFGVYLGLGGAG